MNLIPQIFVGIDIGTSGCRGCAIDIKGQIIAEQAIALSIPKRRGVEVEQDPVLWWEALKDTHLLNDNVKRVQIIASVWGFIQVISAISKEDTEISYFLNGVHVITENVPSVPINRLKSIHR